MIESCSRLSENCFGWEVEVKRNQVEESVANSIHQITFIAIIFIFPFIIIFIILLIILITNDDDDDHDDNFVDSSCSTDSAGERH